jgi:hypothetical protein
MHRVLARRPAHHVATPGYTYALTAHLPLHGLPQRLRFVGGVERVARLGIESEVSSESLLTPLLAPRLQRLARCILDLRTSRSHLGSYLVSKPTIFSSRPIPD